MPPSYTIETACHGRRPIESRGLALAMPHAGFPCRRSRAIFDRHIHVLSIGVDSEMPLVATLCHRTSME